MPCISSQVGITQSYLLKRDDPPFVVIALTLSGTRAFQKVKTVIVCKSSPISQVFTLLTVNNLTLSMQ